MSTSETDLHVLDLDFLGHAGVIARGLLKGSSGAALVDPGPATCLPGLRRALEGHGAAVGDLEAILVTHIHLDHAGAAGSLVRENPRLQVYVHERGAPHLIDPGRLLESASRLYGDRMDQLWGETVPVPAANVHVLTGGEHLTVAGRRIDVLYTPGHASHHVSYFDPSGGVAFVGDTGGIRAGESDYLAPPTPPPDIALDAWSDSIERILAWAPRALFVTHFGLVPSPADKLRALERRLRANAALVRESLGRDGTDQERIAWFAVAVAADLRQHLSDEEATRCELAVSAEHCWLGLARYWRTRAARAGGRS